MTPNRSGSSEVCTVLCLGTSIFRGKSPNFSQKGLPPFFLRHINSTSLKSPSPNLFSLYHQRPSRHHSGCGPRWWHQHGGRWPPPPHTCCIRGLGPGALPRLRDWVLTGPTPVGLPASSPASIPTSSPACSSQNGLFQTCASIVGTPPLPALKLLRELASP